MASNVQIRFTSKRFVIEQATLWIYTSPGQTLEALAADLEPLSLVDGAVDTVMDQPGHVDGFFFEVRYRRVSDGTTASASSEFSHQVTEEDWRSGVTTVNMDAYREVVIKVHDKEGHPVRGAMLGFVRFGKEGGIDLTADDRGESRLLLPPGTYGTRMPEGPRVQFEVTAADTDEILEITPPTG